MKLHIPTRGGSHDEMAAVNAAYEAIRKEPQNAR